MAKSLWLCGERLRNLAFVGSLALFLSCSFADNACEQDYCKLAQDHQQALKAWSDNIENFDAAQIETRLAEHDAMRAEISTLASKADTATTKRNEIIATIENLQGKMSILENTLKAHDGSIDDAQLALGGNEKTSQTVATLGQKVDALEITVNAVASGDLLSVDGSQIAALTEDVADTRRKLTDLRDDAVLWKNAGPAEKAQARGVGKSVYRDPKLIPPAINVDYTPMRDENGDIQYYKNSDGTFKLDCRWSEGTPGTADYVDRCEKVAIPVQRDFSSTWRMKGDKYEFGREVPYPMPMHTNKGESVDENYMINKIPRRRFPITHVISIITDDVTAEIEAGHTFNFMTYNYTVPGPPIRVRVGDWIDFTLINEGYREHSLDFHATTGPGGGAAALRANPGESARVVWKAIYPGMFIYHCASNWVSDHISEGGYGAIIVENHEGFPYSDVDLFMAQGDLYLNEPMQTGPFPSAIQKPFGKFVNMHNRFNKVKERYEMHDIVMFNGEPWALVKNPVVVDIHDVVRIFIVTGGANTMASFHIIGDHWDRVWLHADNSNLPMENVQTTVVPPGGCAMVDFRLDNPGRYIFVDHALVRTFTKGNLGFIMSCEKDDAYCRAKGEAGSYPATYTGDQSRFLVGGNLQHKNDGPGLMSNDPCVYTSWIREGTDRVTSEDTRQEMYAWLMANCPSTPEVQAEDRDFASAPVVWGYDANRVDYDHFRLWKEFAWNKNAVPSVPISRTDPTKVTMTASGLLNTGNPFPSSGLKLPSVRYQLLQKRDFVFEKRGESTKDDWFKGKLVSEIKPSGDVVQIPSSSPGASWDSNLIKLPNGNIAMSNNDGNFFFPMGLDTYSQAAAQWAVDPSLLQVKQATSLPTRYNFVVVGGKTYTVESRMRGPNEFNGHDAKLRIFQVDPDTYEVLSSKDLSCDLGKASGCSADGTTYTSYPSYLQLNMLGVIAPEDDTTACGGKGGMIVGTSGYPYYEALGHSENIAAMGIVKYDYHPTVALVCADEDMTVAWRYDNGGVYVEDEDAETVNGVTPKFRTRMPKIGDKVPDTKFVDNVEFVPTMSKISNIYMDISRMVASKISLELSRAPSTSELNVDDIILVPSSDATNFPMPTMLVVEGFSNNVLDVSIMLWNGLDLRNSPTVRLYRMSDQTISLSALSESSVVELSDLTLKNINKMEYTFGVPTKSDVSGAKAKISVSTIVMTITKERMNAARSGSSMHFGNANRGEAFESDAEIQGMFNWGGSFWALASVDVENGNVALACGNGHRDSVSFVLSTQRIKHRVDQLDINYQSARSTGSLADQKAALDKVAAHMLMAGALFANTNIIPEQDKAICQSGGLVLDINTGEKKANIRGHQPDSWVVYSNTYSGDDTVSQMGPWTGEDREKLIYALGFDSWRDLDFNNVVAADDEDVMMMTSKGGAVMFTKRSEPANVLTAMQITALPQSAPGTTAPFNFHGACYVGEGVFALRTPATDQAVHLETHPETTGLTAPTAGWLSVIKIDTETKQASIVHQLILGENEASNHASTVSCAGGQVGVFVTGSTDSDVHEYRIYDIGNCDHTSPNSCRFSTIPIPKAEVKETRYVPVTAMWDEGYLYVKSDTALRKFVMLPGIGDDEVDKRNPALMTHAAQIAVEQG
eukprot:gene691-1148_t